MSLNDHDWWILDGDGEARHGSFDEYQQQVAEDLDVSVVVQQCVGLERAKSMYVSTLFVGTMVEHDGPFESAVFMIETAESQHEWLTSLRTTTRQEAEEAHQLLVQWTLGSEVEEIWKDPQ